MNGAQTAATWQGGVNGGGRKLSSRRAVCVWIPLFPLRSEIWRRPDLAGKPAALLSTTDARRVWQLAPQARRAGVRPGMTVSQAIGLCPSLALCQPDPVYYDEQFSRLLLALDDVSPVIEPAELGRVFVGVDGLDRLYVDPHQQSTAIRQGIRNGERERGEGEGCCRFAVGPHHRGWAAVARLGWGNDKFTAWVAATRANPGETIIISTAEERRFLATQPVAVLPISPDTHRRLQQLGIKTLADLARLPQSAIASQYGREGRTAWQLATGNFSELVTGREHPEPIVAALDFLTPAADLTMLVHATEKLIERALKHPRRAGWRVHQVRLRAGLEHGTSWMTEVTLKDPSADGSRIAAPLAVRFRQSPPVGPVDHLVVEFTAFAHGTDELQLFARDARSAARAGQQQALHAAVNEINARLKRQMLYHIIEVQPWSRIPERRYALIDFEL